MKSKAPALQRGIDILQLVGKTGRVTPTQFEQQLGIPRASLNRFISCLVENEFLDPVDEGGFRLGSDLLRLVMTAYEQDSLVKSVMPLLKQLACQWRQSFVCYGYREKFTIEWLAKVEAPGGIKTMVPGFRTQHLNMNAQGQLFLSFLDDSRIKEYVESGFVKAATEYSLTGYDELLKRCQEIRRSGYAWQRRENSLVMQQLAVPLQISGDSRRYVLGCFLPLEFSEIERLREDMLLACSQLSDWL